MSPSRLSSPSYAQNSFSADNSTREESSGLVVLDDDFATDPWQHYAAMRADSPMTRVVMRFGVPMWLVTSHKLGKFVLSDSRFKRDIHHIAQIFDHYGKQFMPASSLQDEKGLESHMLNKDAPDHTRLRKLAMQAFTPGTVKRLTERIHEVCTELIADIPHDQVVDFSPALSYPLPITIICEILGVTDHEDRKDFKHWSYVLLNRVKNNDFTEFLACRDAMYDKLSSIITAKRAELAHRDPIDLLDELIISRFDKDCLSDRELISMAFLLLVAGHETTVTLINNALIRLATNPELAERLRRNEADIPIFIEEILRIDSPVQFSALRFASEPMTIEGIEVEKDDIFIVSLLAANHDPDIYANPDELTIERKTTHLAFGHGSHFCLGAALARTEATIAITHVLRAFSHIDLAIPESELTWRPSGVVRGREAVPLIAHR